MGGLWDGVWKPREILIEHDRRFVGWPKGLEKQGGKKFFQGGPDGSGRLIYLKRPTWILKQFCEFFPSPLNLELRQGGSPLSFCGSDTWSSGDKLLIGCSPWRRLASLRQYDRTGKMRSPDDSSSWTVWVGRRPLRRLAHTSPESSIENRDTST